MKHPVWDRILILLCALIALGCAAGVVALLIGKISFDMITGWITSVDMSRFIVKAAMAGIAALFVLLFPTALCDDSAVQEEAFEQLCHPAQRKRHGSHFAQGT